MLIWLKLSYLCTVFFIVLDLRLTKDRDSAESFFYALTSAGAFCSVPF